MTDLNELMGSPFVRVKVVAFVHFIFISNAMLGSWGHGAYEFYNFLFIISLFWTIHSKESIEAVQTMAYQLHAKPLTDKSPAAPRTNRSL